MTILVPTIVRSTLAKAVEIAFPWQCVVCQSRDTDNRHDMFCAECSTSLTRPIIDSCQRCAAEVGPFTSTEQGCVHCRSRKPSFDSAVCLGMYDETMRRAIVSSKWSHSAAGMKALGRLLVKQQLSRIEEWDIDVIVPIPQPWTTRLIRPFNSASVVAEEVSRHTGVNIDHQLLHRTRATRPQKRVAVHRRFENQKGAFRVQNLKSFEGKRVLLVDDVMTTGATCSEASRMFKRCKAKAVHVAVVARVLDNG